MGGIDTPMSALRLGPSVTDERSALKLGPTTTVVRSARKMTGEKTKAKVDEDTCPLAPQGYSARAQRHLTRSALDHDDANGDLDDD